MIGKPANTLEEIENLAVGLAFEIRQREGSGGERDGPRHRDGDFDVRPVGGDDPVFWVITHKETGLEFRFEGAAQSRDLYAIRPAELYRRLRVGGWRKDEAPKE